jgi:hypothetical protein
MKPADQYAVTFGYLATTTINGQPYTHRGQDRSCPTGTPIVIAGQTIGLTGNTGLSTGPHLHTQAGYDSATQNTIHPSGHEFKEGTVTALRTTDTASWGKYITIRNLSGVYITYAHLSQVNVQVGQKIGGNQLMDTDAKVANQYHTLRGNSGTAAERKAWIGKSYEEFNATAKPEVASREANRLNLENAVRVLTTERDAARTQVATLTKEVLGLRDQVKVLQGQVAEKDATIQGQIESTKQLEAQHQAQIAELNKVIEIKDNEIKRLTAELANCDGTGESLTWSQHLVLGVKGFLAALNPLSK